MDSIELVISTSVIADETALCRGLSLNSADLTVVADATSDCSANLLILEIEPRQQMEFIETLKLMTSGQQLMLFGATFNSISIGESILLFDPNFICLKGAEMLLFSPFRSMWAPVEAILNMSPRWMLDAPIEGTLRDTCVIKELPLSAAARWVIDAALSVKKDNAAVDVTSVVRHVTELPMNASMVRPWADVEASAETISEIVVSIKPHGGVIEGLITLAPAFCLEIPIDGRIKQNSASAGISIHPRCTYEVEAELRVEAVAA